MVRSASVAATALFVLIVVLFATDDLRWLFAALIATLCFWLVCVTLALMHAIRSFRRKAWLAGVGCLALPVLVPLTACWLGPYARYPIDDLHFAMMRHAYDRSVAQLPMDGKRYAEFNWGGALFASRGVAFDETDEIALPYGHQSAAWKKRVDGDLTCGGNGPIGPVTRVAAHYYVTSFGC